MNDDDEHQHQAKRLKASLAPSGSAETANSQDDSETTEFKLAILASLHPGIAQEVLLDYLLAHDGNQPRVSAALTSGSDAVVKRKRGAANGYQSSLHSYAKKSDGTAASTCAPAKLLTKKGKTLHLYIPEDIETHTPCSIVHNFLPPELADDLTRELLNEAPEFQRGTFQLFDRTVQSPHTWKFYVDSLEEVQEQQTQYVYDGVYESHIGQALPQMLSVSALVQARVNEEIQRRNRDFHPGGKKLKFQTLDEWRPNASFVNCYDGGKENVGYHSDQLTYLGPRAVIGSLSLGVTREFRVRRIIPQVDVSSADEQGQIAIHLPHNSLLVMHAEMQELWKHSIAPAQAIDPHPLAGNKRLNITYRWYKDHLHPKHTPRCRCDVPMALRCVQKRQATKGRYMWMCYANYTPGKKGCSDFVWAEFDEDGRPPWAEGYKGNANVPAVAEYRESEVIVP